MLIKTYLKEIKNLYSPTSNEHTYRTPLENLWNSQYKSDFPIIQESSTTQGIPDFTIKNTQGQTIDFIECKYIDSDLIIHLILLLLSYHISHNMKYLHIKHFFLLLFLF